MINSIDLVWIVVNDIKKAIDFYTKVVGLELLEFDETYFWAELGGKNKGTRLGIAQKQPEQGCCGIEPGQNAMMTFNVDNIESSVADLTKKGAKLLGDIQEVPGHVKLQTLQDLDGNHMQIVQVLKHKCCSGH